jgi:hypothetical protein
VGSDLLTSSIFPVGHPRLFSSHPHPRGPAAGRQFRGDQVFAGNEAHLQIRGRIYDFIDPMLPCCVKVNSGNLRKDINSNRLATYTEERALLREICNSQINKRGSAFAFSASAFTNMSRSFVARSCA